MKNIYKKPLMTVLKLYAEDVMTASSGGMFEIGDDFINDNIGRLI